MPCEPQTAWKLGKGLFNTFMEKSLFFSNSKANRISFSYQEKLLTWDISFSKGAAGRMRHPLCLKIKYVNLSWGQDLDLPHLCSNLPYPAFSAWSGGWCMIHAEQILERWRERGGEKEKGRQAQQQGKPIECPSCGALNSLHQFFKMISISYKLYPLQSVKCKHVPFSIPFLLPSFLPDGEVGDRGLTTGKLDFHGSCLGTTGTNGPFYEQLCHFLNGFVLAPQQPHGADASPETSVRLESRRVAFLEEGPPRLLLVNTVTFISNGSWGILTSL